AGLEGTRGDLEGAPHGIGGAVPEQSAHRRVGRESDPPRGGGRPQGRDKGTAETGSRLLLPKWPIPGYSKVPDSSVQASSAVRVKAASSSACSRCALGVSVHAVHSLHASRRRAICGGHRIRGCSDRLGDLLTASSEVG